MLSRIRSPLTTWPSSAARSGRKRAQNSRKASPLRVGDAPNHAGKPTDPRKASPDKALRSRSRSPNAFSTAKKRPESKAERLPKPLTEALSDAKARDSSRIGACARLSPENAHLCRRPISRASPEPAHELSCSSSPSAPNPITAQSRAGSPRLP
jgi:hypothetical protein